MSTANTGANQAPDNNKCIDFTPRRLMEALQWVITNGLKWADFTSRTDKNKSVRISDNGRMVFYTRVRFNGERPRIELGEFSTHSLDQIHQAYLEVRKNIADGIDPRLIRRRDVTYAAFFDQVYITDRQTMTRRASQRTRAGIRIGTAFASYTVFACKPGGQILLNCPSVE